MQSERAPLPRVTFLLAGFAVGAIARLLATGNQRQSAAVERSLADTQARLAQQESVWQQKFDQVEARLNEHEARFNDVPSTGQIVAAMEDLLGRTMQSLDQRFSAQAEAVDLLKTTVSQTDTLLERVLESLESLRQDAPDATPSRARE